DQALRFDNVDSNEFGQLRIKSPPQSVTTLMPPQLTVELWIEPQGPGFNHTTDDPYGADILYRGDDIVPAGLTVASWVLRWCPPSNQPCPQHLNFQLNSSDTVGEIWFSNAVVPLNSKAHIAMTFDGSVARLYVNGELDTEKAWNHAIYYEADDAVWVGTGQGVLTDTSKFLRRVQGPGPPLRARGPAPPPTANRPQRQ